MDLLRHAIRSLRRSPAFTLTVIVTVGIGIGLNAAIFTVVDCVLLRPLGYHDSGRIVALRSHFDDENRSIPLLGGGDYEDIVHRVKGLDSAAYYQAWADGIQFQGTSLYVPIARVSPQFSEVLGLEPVAGRLFHPGDASGTDVLVSAQFARDHFASPDAAVGQPITWTGTIYTIAGVLPTGFSFPSRTQVWFEGDAKPENLNRSAFNQHAIAKRRPGVTNTQLNAELDSLSTQLQRAYPEDRNKTLEAIGLQDQVVGPIKPTLHLLMGAVLIVLLIVCANVTHLQLVRETRQLRAATIRTALGATRVSLAARALAETGLLASGGAIAAVLFASPALRLLVRLAPENIPRLADVHLNVHVLLFSVGLSLATMTVTALLPLWHSWHLDPASALRQDASRGTESRSSVRLRNGFLVAEVALTLTLSVAAVLLTRQLIAQSRTDLGFSPDHLITLDAHSVLSTPPPVASDQSPAAQATAAAAWSSIEDANAARLDRTLETVAAIPGVEKVAAIGGAPMGFGGSDVGYAIKGRQEFLPGAVHLPDAEIRPVSTEFLAAMHIPLTKGRNITPEDRLNAPPVLLVNEALARRDFPGQNPIGQQIMCGFTITPAWWTIVGVVGDIRDSSPAASATPTMYIPLSQNPGSTSNLQILVRTRTEPAGMIETLRRTLAASHPDVALKATTMQENIGETQRGEHFRTLLFASFAAVSILLAAVGMYGVTAYTVSQRRFEFGLRMALGADRSQVLRMVLLKAISLAGLGVLIGVTLSLGLSRLLSSVIGTLPAFDAVAYLVAAVAVLTIAGLASLPPARSATSVNLTAVLRGE